MKKHEIHVGAVYAVKVSGRVVPVKIITIAGSGGWYGISLVTHAEVRIKSAQRCRWRCTDDGSLTPHKES